MEYRALCTTFLPILPINPIPPRRPLTSYGERTSNQVTRPKSALHTSSRREMPRNHVNIARFYDWSDDLGTCVSVTKLYRDIASMTRINNDVKRPLNIQWCSNGVRLTPGRMFSREKNALTKGEREIINGICRNRSCPKEYYDPPNIKSHQDAWLAGKQMGRGSSRRGDGSDSGMDSYRTPRDSVNTSRLCMDCSSTDMLSRMVKSASSRSKVEGYYCVKGRPVTRSSDNGYNSGDGAIPSAPPSTPERVLNTRPRVPPINNGQGAILIENVREARHSARKVRMDVFLPRITSELLDDETYHSRRVQQPASDHVISNSDSSFDSTTACGSSVYLHHRAKDESLHLHVGE